jgi:hypothetical protein
MLLGACILQKNSRSDAEKFIVRLDYCGIKLSVRPSTIKPLLYDDSYEQALRIGVERFFDNLLNQPFLSICQTIAQISLPCSYLIRVPIYSFVDFKEMPPCTTVGLRFSFFQTVSMFR